MISYTPWCGFGWSQCQNKALEGIWGWVVPPPEGPVTPSEVLDLPPVASEILVS